MTFLSTPWSAPRAGLVAGVAACLLGAAYCAGHASVVDAAFALRIAGCALLAALVFAVHVGVAAAILRLQARRAGERRARRRVGAPAELAIDPLAEEDAELEARFAACEAEEVTALLEK